MYGTTLSTEYHILATQGKLTLLNTCLFLLQTRQVDIISHADPAESENAETCSPPVQTLRVGGAASEQEEVAVQVTRVLVESYFDIVRSNLQDSVPKARFSINFNPMIRRTHHHSMCTSGIGLRVHRSAASRNICLYPEMRANIYAGQCSRKLLRTHCFDVARL